MVWRDTWDSTTTTTVGNWPIEYINTPHCLLCGATESLARIPYGSEHDGYLCGICVDKALDALGVPSSS